MIEIAKFAAAYPTATLALAAAFDLACWAGVLGCVAVRRKSLTRAA